MPPEVSRESELARRILMWEHAHAGDAGTPVATGERVFRRLRADLSQWFGSEGVDALLSRAVDRAQLRQDFFPGSESGPPSGPAVDRLVQDMRSRSADEAARIVTDALAAFIALLGRLVGDDMAERLIEQSWKSIQNSRQQRSVQ